MKVRFLTALTCAICFTGVASGDVETLSADVAHRLVQRGELVLIDVRSPTEWAMTGMPRDSIGAPLQAADFIAQARGAVLGDLDQPVAVIDRAGESAMRAATRLEAEGFGEIYIVQGGMSGTGAKASGWLTNDLPTDGFITSD